MLLDVGDGHLKIKVTGVFPADLIEAIEDGFESFEIDGGVDLLIQTLEFFERIEVFRAHDDILH